MVKKQKYNVKIAYYLNIVMLALALTFCFILPGMDSVFRLYFMGVSLWILAIFAMVFLGFKKDKHYLKGSAVRQLIVVLLAFEIVTYALGLFLGFNHTLASLNLERNMVSSVPTLMIILSTEVIRWCIAKNFTTDRRPLIIYTVLSAMVYISLEISPNYFEDFEGLFLFFCVSICVHAARSALSSFLMHRIAFAPAIIFMLVMSMLEYIAPIVPNLGDYIYSIANIIMPFIVYYSISKMALNYDKDKQALRRMNWSIVTAPIIIILLVLTILTSGIFHYKLIAIGSNSMRPSYSRGDAILFEKAQANEMQIGDILVFNREGKTITHRIIDIKEKNGHLIFRTKGDANAEPDGWETGDTEIFGRAILVSKYIGFPTLWINNMFKTEI